jgi:hypothetical protein
VTKNGKVVDRIVWQGSWLAIGVVAEFMVSNQCSEGFMVKRSIGLCERFELEERIFCFGYVGLSLA